MPVATRTELHPLALLLLALALLAAVATAATAANPLEKLLMPGPVVRSHADIETKCEACHEPFSKATQDRLCLDCHKPVGADIQAKTGFHGRSKLMRGVACNFCHDDHKGRDADIVGLDQAIFDHADADFGLTGAHLAVPCGECHQPGKRWAEAPRTCIGCHDKDQPHQGRLGKDCASCHTLANWREMLPFDHGRTGFPLAGKHAGVSCQSCHLGEVWKGVSTTCNDCHSVQDVHRQRFGTACQSCHQVTGWTPAKFDHGANTRFPLDGAHARAVCAACHGSDVLKPLARDCFSCHAAQDVHKAELGPACGDCHTTAAWRTGVRFDHDLTRFPLSGLHIAVACESCHATPAFREAKTACADCHAADDVHKGRLTARCETCHDATGWSRVSFDHGRDTRFPLTGKHKAAACYDCHAKPGVASARLPADCYSCHAKEDVHRGKFGRNCAQCHDTLTFKTAIIRR